MESRADASWPSTIALLVRALTGFVAGAALLLINVHGSGPSRSFASHGEATLWFILIAGQAAFWAVVTSYVWKISWHYVRRSGRDLGRIALSIAVIFVLLIGVPIAVRLVEGPVNPIWRAGWKIPLLTVAGFVLVVLPSLMGALGIQAFSVRSLGSTIEESDIDGFIELRDDLNRFLALLGASIGLAVLSTGALRNAVLAYNPKAHLPTESVLQYGAARPPPSGAPGAWRDGVSRRVTPFSAVSGRGWQPTSRRVMEKVRKNARAPPPHPAARYRQRRRQTVGPCLAASGGQTPR